MDPQAPVRSGWRLRPVMTGVIGALAALLVQHLTARDYARVPVVYPPTWQVALATAIGVAGALAIFTVERVRTFWAVAFAVTAGMVAGLILWWNGPAGGSGDWFWDWRTACLFLAIAVTAPLFQTARDAGAARFAYPEVHGHAWTNVVLWCAGGLFVAIAFALAFLLSELFALIGITLLRDLLRHDWATTMLAGGAFGAAVGLLRERDAIVRTLQRVVTAILSILTPVLAAGLVLFLVALPFTGLSALWDATRSTTPILLSCIIGALILTNATIGDDADAEATNPVLRWAAMALAAAALPLAIIAAIATGLRIGQHGFTPDRLWGLTFVVVATAYGVAYLDALLRHRQGWSVALRRSNLRLAFALLVAALLLATPLTSFNALSARDQMARLTSGRITPDRFDWTALAFDFGAPGRAALARLSRLPDARIAKLARQTATLKNRWLAPDIANQARVRDAIASHTRVLPLAVPLPPSMRDALVGYEACGQGDRCTLYWPGGASEAFAVRDACVRELGNAGGPIVERLADRDCPVTRLRLDKGKWSVAPAAAAPQREAAGRAAIVAGFSAGMVEVRPVERRQLFIGGRPVGDVFE